VEFDDLPISEMNLSQNERILFVGNADKEFHLLEKRMHAEGFQFATMTFGSDYRSTFKEGKPDLILIDIDKGEWHSRQLSDFIKNKIDRTIPVILVVYRNDYDAINHGSELKVAEFIVKPVNWLMMKNRIKNVLLNHYLVSEQKEIRQQYNQTQKLANFGSWELGESRSVMKCSEGVSYIFDLNENVREITLKKFIKFVHPDDSKDIANLLRQAINRMYPFKRDHRIILEDGTEKIVDHKVFMVWDRIKKKRKVVGTIQDITLRKFNEYIERDRSRVLEMIVRNESLGSIFKELIHIITYQRTECGCVISRLRNNRLTNQAASPNLPREFLKAIDGHEIGPKSGSAGAGAYLGELVSSSDISKSPLWESSKKIALKYDLNACHAYPVMSSKGEVFGMISLFYSHVCFLEESVISLLKVVSDLASIAIERIRLNRQLVYHARHDSLTTLPNRLFFSERLNEITRHAKRYNEQTALLFIDLDRFKQVNDSLGHKIGDVLLKEVAVRISALTRETDVLARVGGDEFIKILTNIEERQNAADAARRIIEEVSKPYMIENHELYVGASIGISIFPEDTQDPVQMQKYADLAMYYAKNRGGMRFQFFTSDMDDKAISRLEIENDLRKALERDEFEVFYQPQFLLKTKQLIGFEALIRWNHPEHGRISPATFIPVAESTDLIIPIGKWVLEEACRQNAAWEKQGAGPFRIAVNASVVQFVKSEFSELVALTLKKFNLEPHRLEIEITESVVIEDIEIVSQRLSEIRALGVKTAIDDFGSGYSSMTYIEGLPVTALKIDQAFVQKIGVGDDSDQKSKILLETFVNLAAKLKLMSIAEGFETEEQYEFLCQIGCDVGQGYYLGVPMSVKDVEFHCKSDLACEMPE